MKKNYFPASLLMAPAYLLLGIVNLYIGRVKKNWGSTGMGMLWMGVSACWTVKALWDIRDAGEADVFDGDDWEED